MVITGLVPVIPLREAWCLSKRDGRDEPGHDNGGVAFFAQAILRFAWRIISTKRVKR
jgi:hypothetical protein